MSWCVLYVFFEKNNGVNSNKKRKNIEKRNIVIKTISKMMDIPCEDLVMGTGKRGKPYFINHEDIKFNISYSYGAWIFAVSDEEVGVDIEKIRMVRPEIIRKCFCNDEMIYLDSSLEQREKRFYNIWTKKEGYTKYTGCGIKRELIKINTIGLEMSKLIKSYELNGYAISLVSPVSNIRINICEQNNIQKSNLIEN